VRVALLLGFLSFFLSFSETLKTKAVLITCLTSYSRKCGCFLVLLKRCAAFLASLWVKFRPPLQLSEHLQWCSVSHPTLHKYFSSPSFFSPATPPIKPKLGLQRGRTQETTSSNPPRPIKLSSQSTGVKLCCACLPASASCATTMQGQNHFAEPKWHVLTFLHPIIVWRVHFLLYLWIGCFVPPSSLWALCSKSPTPG
jgi:hypothetical protein